jgi:uncharacterized RDD family membrane protein YckC
VSHAEEPARVPATSHVPARRAHEVASRVHGETEVVAQPGTPYEGLVTRTLAFAVDAAVINGVAAGVGVVLGLALSILELPSGFQDFLVALGAFAWFVWTIGYFVTFWSSTGQTPGNRLLRIRVCDARDRTPLRPRRSFMRLVYLLLAALPLFLGFVPILLDSRRRGVHDMLARSVVVGAEPEAR